jgi:hypothetical protein
VSLWAGRDYPAGILPLNISSLIKIKTPPVRAALCCSLQNGQLIYQKKRPTVGLETAGRPVPVPVNPRVREGVSGKRAEFRHGIFLRTIPSIKLKGIVAVWSQSRARALPSKYVSSIHCAEIRVMVIEQPKLLLRRIKLRVSFKDFPSARTSEMAYRYGGLFNAFCDDEGNLDGDLIRQQSSPGCV